MCEGTSGGPCVGLEGLLEFDFRRPISLGSKGSTLPVTPAREVTQSYQDRAPARQVGLGAFGSSSVYAIVAPHAGAWRIKEAGIWQLES